MLARMFFAGASVLALAFSMTAIAAGGSHDRGPTAGRLASGGCDKAGHNFVHAKQKLKKLKKSGAAAGLIQQAKHKLKKAKNAVDQACGSGATFDVTGLGARFDDTVTRQENQYCSITKDAHWTASLAPGGAGPAKLQVYYRDKLGRPVFSFTTAAPDITTASKGTGTATETCNTPWDSGTATCTFDLALPGHAAVSSDPDSSRDPMSLDWFWGFNSFSYGPKNGGSCSSTGSGAEISPSEDSGGLFVSPLNDGSDISEPKGINNISASAFQSDVTLQFTGGGSVSFPGEFGPSNATLSYHLSIGLHRR